MNNFSKTIKVICNSLALLMCIAVTSYAASSTDIKKMQKAMSTQVSSFCRGFNSQCPITIDNDTTVLSMTESDSWWNGKSVVIKIKVLFLHEMVVKYVKSNLIDTFKKNQAGKDFMAACWISKTKIKVELEAVHDQETDGFELDYSDMGSEARNRIEALKKEGF